ncbi:unnamed protein product [Didymodactylos carnosus]|uniref:G-protein coupled receptors family 1 profile domain-containing protein n=1 Tax=Didymodactylos carnosus TaxID=1234261 RepID=A0A815P3P9_9BILA|nr:unnamed protein product [Didymodactylos carnosus]CAF4319028.1 unnamed protein product [Didymodactylos carnosus]
MNSFMRRPTQMMMSIRQRVGVLYRRSKMNNTNVEWLPYSQLIACIFYSVILCVGVTGNVLVIVVVILHRDMRNATNLLLTNLSLADLLLLVFCTADGYQHLYAKENHRLGKFMCKYRLLFQTSSFSPFVQNVTGTCSVLTIMAISYERYVAICQPLKSSVKLTLFRTFPTVFFFWFISCLLSAPFFVYTNTSLEKAIYNETIISCMTEFPKSWFNWYLVPCTLCIPILILSLLCYWHLKICRILFNPQALLQDNTVVTRYRRQVAIMLVTLTVTFFVLILPHKIWGIIQPNLTMTQFYSIGFPKHSLIIIFTRTLLYLNSAINPILYSIMSTKFRQSFVLLFGCGANRPVLLCKQYYAMKQLPNNSHKQRSASQNITALTATVHNIHESKIPFIENNHHQNGHINI